MMYDLRFKKKGFTFSRSQRGGGFTLIELLVVIAIIGVLTALSLPNFVLSRQRARDTQRKNDIKQIQKAFELYKLDQSPVTYPTSGVWSGLTCGSAWTSGSATYMTKFPCDPLSAAKYTYTLNISDSTKYTLYACLENASDVDGTTQASCSSGKMYQVTEP